MDAVRMIKKLLDTIDIYGNVEVRIEGEKIDTVAYKNDEEYLDVSSKIFPDVIIKLT